MCVFQTKRKQGSELTLLVPDEIIDKFAEGLRDTMGDIRASWAWRRYLRFAGLSSSAISALTRIMIVRKAFLAPTFLLRTSLHRLGCIHANAMIHFSSLIG